MLRIQNRHVDGEEHQIAIRGKRAKDRENRRIPFVPGILRSMVSGRSTSFPSPSADIVFDISPPTHRASSGQNN